MSEAATTTRSPSDAELDVELVRHELLQLLQRAGTVPERPPVEAPPAKELSTTGAAAVTSVRGAVARPEVNDAATDENDGPTPTCVHCGNLESWGNASWCPKCGYFPSLGRAGEIPVGEDGDSQLTLRDLLPRWLVLIIVGLIVIFGLSALMERALTGHPGFLTLCSLVQLSFGGIIALVAHVQAVLMGMRDPHAPDLKTMLMNPCSVWTPVLRNLRERSHLLVNFSWGLSACVAAAMIYGPIRMAEMERELAELREKKAKRSVMGTMIGTMAKATGGAAAQGGGGSGDIEDAIGEFAGMATEQGGLDETAAQPNGRGPGGGSIDDAVSNFASTGGDAAGLKDRPPPASTPGGLPSGQMAAVKTSPGEGRFGPSTSPSGIKRNGAAGASTAAPDRQRMEAVVFGYLASVDGDVRTLLLASPGPDGRPRYAGKLTAESLPSGDWETISQQLPQMRSRRPLVSCPHHGHWVEPRVVLEISFDRLSSTGFVGAQATTVRMR